MVSLTIIPWKLVYTATGSVCLVLLNSSGLSVNIPRKGQEEGLLTWSTMQIGITWVNKLQLFTYPMRSRYGKRYAIKIVISSRILEKNETNFRQISNTSDKICTKILQWTIGNEKYSRFPKVTLALI